MINPTLKIQNLSFLKLPPAFTLPIPLGLCNIEVKSATGGQGNSASVAIFIWTGTFWSLQKSWERGVPHRRTLGSCHLKCFCISAGLIWSGRPVIEECYNMGVWPQDSDSWKKHHHPFCELWLAKFFTLGKSWSELQKTAAVGIASILTWPNCMEKAGL